MRKLHGLQNEGLYCALGRSSDTIVDELHEEGDLLRLKYRRLLPLLNFMFDEEQIESNFKGQKQTRATTRLSRKKLLKVERPKTEKFKKSLSYEGPMKWNALPVDFQLLESKHNYKCKVRDYVTSKSRKAAATKG